MVERIVSFPTPTRIKELQRFMGMINYYRQYIPDLSTIAEPLHMLMRKSSTWNWDVKCQEAFQTLCRRLAHEPVVLAHPKWDSPFFVEADASSVGVAAVLSQEDPRTGILRPISYFSTTLNGSQRRYSAGQREAWALVSATRKWYDYLRAATHVYLITDHNPLVWMKKQKDPRNTFARWIMELEDLDYEVVYRKGSDNTVADTLSRGTNFYDEEVNCESRSKIGSTFSQVTLSGLMN